MHIQIALMLLSLTLAFVSSPWTVHVIQPFSACEVRTGVYLSDAHTITGHGVHTGWPLAAYVLIGRDDIAATVQASAGTPVHPPPSSVPLAGPESSLALATPLHHGAGSASSPKRPSLGRTPIRQPQLGTLPGDPKPITDM